MRYFITGMIVVTLLLSILFYEQVAAIVVVVGYTAVTLFALLSALTLFFGGWNLAERIKLTRARRIEAEKQAHVLTVSDNGETWVRDTDPKATWRNLTGNPALYVNGQQHNPQEWELELHRLKLAALATTRTAAQVIPGQAHLLPEAAAPLDLLTVFTQPLQAYAIIGGQQTGKTFQARHLAAYWVRQGIKPVVLGPKWDRGEWDGCYLIGGNGDFAAVEWGINLVRRLVEQRHAAQVAHKSHPIQPIFFDDWTPIVDAVSSARALVLEATTLYASVNVLLYFILHSDTAHAWGVDRKGAALKDNFVKLLIQPAYDAAGLIDRSQTAGVIRFAGEATERPTRLFTTPPPSWGRPVAVRPGRVKPSAQEAQILKLHESGESLSEIARRVYGSKGGKQVNQIKEIINQFN